MMKVEQMINNRGNGAMNQFVIYGNGHIVFQSYSSMIADVDFNTNTITIGENWNYSRTTAKHRNIFFKEYASFVALSTTDELRKAIKDGKYSHELDGTWTIKTA